MEDKVRMVGVRRCAVHARVDPAWANPGHPSPLSVPLRPPLPGSPVSGTARVPAPLRKRRAVRRVTKCPWDNGHAAASVTLLPALCVVDEASAKFECLLYTYPQAPVKHRAPDSGLSGRVASPTEGTRGSRGAPGGLADVASLPYNALYPILDPHVR
jgi:hypothetical protein